MSNCQCKITQNACEIIPRLWLGNAIVAKDKQFIDDHQIKYIINLTNERQNNFSDIKYLWIPIQDKNICTDDLSDFFDLTNKFILNVYKDSKDSILIYCKKGHDKAGSIVVAFLIKYLDIEFGDAIECIREHKPCVFKSINEDESCVIRALYKYYQSYIIRPIKIPLIY